MRVGSLSQRAVDMELLIDSKGCQVWSLWVRGCREVVRGQCGCVGALLDVWALLPVSRILVALSTLLMGLPTAFVGCVARDPYACVGQHAHTPCSSGLTGYRG